jgi:hypothetical protein
MNFWVDEMMIYSSHDWDSLHCFVVISVSAGFAIVDEIRYTREMDCVSLKL